MKGIITIGIAVMMMASVFAMIVPYEAEAAVNMKSLAMYPAGITPTDIAWKPDGSQALMVGTDSAPDGHSAAL